MFKYHCLNPISPVGMGQLDANYENTENAADADLILVRSAKMHEMEFGENLKAIARAGAGVNNIPLDRCAEEGIVVFNTPGANANGVKELVIAGMLLAARDVVGGIEWVKASKDNADIAKAAEKEKKKFAGTEVMGKKLGVPRGGRLLRCRHRYLAGPVAAALRITVVSSVLSVEHLSLRTQAGPAAVVQ